MTVSNAKPAEAEIIEIPMLIEGEWVRGETLYDVRDPYRGDIVSRAPEASAAEIERALASSYAARKKVAAMTALQRSKLLHKAADIVATKTDLLCELMTRETGKLYSDCYAEVSRSPDTLHISAEEAIRIEGEHVPVEGSAIGAGKTVFMLRYPLGVVAAITPYNAPINLTCHKIGPAIAAGNAVILKAPPQCPATIHTLIECFVEAGFPPGFINVVYGNSAGPAIVKDQRVEFISFTGSTRTGAAIKAAAGLRRVALEMGGLGSTIVHDDADIPEAAKICARNAMRIAGQSCASVQNVYVHRSRYDEFVELAVASVKTFKLGDPFDKTADLGPMIDEANAARVEASIKDAVAKGARLMTGGKRNGQMVEPTVLVDVKQTMTAVCEEVFGPVLSIAPYDDIDEVIDIISENRLGLQAGIFTKSLPIAIKTWKNLRVGGVIINGTSTWRADQLAYGGIKNSGNGREGPKYAIRDMTEQRLVVFNL